MQQSSANIPVQLGSTASQATASQAPTAADYVIPSSVYPGAAGLRPLGLSMLVCTVLGSLGGLDMAITMLFVGFGLGIILTFINAVRVGSKAQAHAKAVFDKHTYHWYHTSFPAHVHENGRLSCRHCNSKKIHVKNLMKRSFMRSHYCGQCGQTLYFSAENL